MQINKKSIKLATIMGLLCTVSSCVKYYDLVKSEFPQGTEQADMRAIAHSYQHSATVYEQFQTKAVFDGLWLSDDVRKAYVDVYSRKRGLSDDSQEELLKRQLEENRHWVSFYLLADIRDKTYATLSDPSSFWTLYLKLNGGQAIMTESIKEVDLEPEYQLFFGKNFMLFKTAYLVKFPRTNDTIINNVKLFIESTYKTCELGWDVESIKKEKRVMRNEDFYWS